MIPDLKLGHAAFYSYKPDEIIPVSEKQLFSLRNDPMAKAPQAANFDDFKAKIPDWIAEEEAKLKELDEARAAIVANLDWLKGSQPKPKRKAPEGPRKERGANQQEIIRILKEVPDGLDRGGILKRKGAEFSDSGISNAITAMKKAGTIGYRKESDIGVYFVP